MKTINYNYDATVVILAQAATVKGNRVQWDRNTYVDFNYSGKLVNIRSVHTGICEFETIFFSDDFNSLTPKSQQFVAAAVLALKTNAAKVGDSMAIIIPQVTVTPVQQKQEALTDQPYAISGHRVEKDPRREETRVNINVPAIEVKGKGGWLLGVGIGIAVVAGIAVAASRN